MMNGMTYGEVAEVEKKLNEMKDTIELDNMSDKDKTIHKLRKQIKEMEDRANEGVELTIKQNEVFMDRIETAENEIVNQKNKKKDWKKQFKTYEELVGNIAEECYGVWDEDIDVFEEKMLEYCKVFDDYEDGDLKTREEWEEQLECDGYVIKEETELDMFEERSEFYEKFFKERLEETHRPYKVKEFTIPKVLIDDICPGLYYNVAYSEDLEKMIVNWGLLELALPTLTSIRGVVVCPDFKNAENLISGRFMNHTSLTKWGYYRGILFNVMSDEILGIECYRCFEALAGENSYTKWIGIHQRHINLKDIGENVIKVMSEESDKVKKDYYTDCKKQMTLDVLTSALYLFRLWVNTTPNTKTWKSLDNYVDSISHCWRELNCDPTKLTTSHKWVPFAFMTS